MPSFIAVNRIYEAREHYFPGVEPWPALAFDEFSPDRFVPIRDLAKGAGTPLDKLETMNPALTSSVWAGSCLLAGKLQATGARGPRAGLSCRLRRLAQ